ncbi:hypothetical protein [Pseudooceanicola sediminis]|nr:hypothetical protein [Pseudooceanicola sediminis]|tara:strand:+ start:53340 stop:53477 length:138 start_codon:yes stop_codon:yes gene_type:complete
MTAEDFADLLKVAGLNLPEADLKGALPAAERLLELANRLPEETDE